MYSICDHLFVIGHKAPPPPICVLSLLHGKLLLCYLATEPAGTVFFLHVK